MWAKGRYFEEKTLLDFLVWYIFLCLSCTNMWSEIIEIILLFVFTLNTINFQWFKANYSIEQKNKINSKSYYHFFDLFYYGFFFNVCAILPN